jgi:hypothetical protein
MGEELKQTYTVRIPEQVAMRMEEVARTHGITPTALIQTLVMRKFKSPESAERETDIAAETAVAAKLETLRKSLEALERGEVARFDQLRLKIVKTRSALLHSLDQTLRGSKKLGLARAECASVEAIDPKHNRITVRTDDGRAVQYNPKRPSWRRSFPS